MDYAFQPSFDEEMVPMTRDGPAADVTATRSAVPGVTRQHNLDGFASAHIAIVLPRRAFLSSKKGPPELERLKTYHARSDLRVIPLIISGKCALPADLKASRCLRCPSKTRTGSLRGRSGVLGARGTRPR